MTKTIIIGDEEYVLASRSKRYLAQSIDVLLPFAMVAVISAIGVLIGSKQSLFVFIPLAFALVYILIADGLFDGRSIGKIALGMKVIHTKTGKPCTVTQSFLRNALYILSIIDWLFIFSQQRRRLGDIVANTVVIENTKQHQPFLARTLAVRLVLREDGGSEEPVIAFLWRWTKTIVVTFFIGACINASFIGTFVNPTGSMANTIMTGDYLVVNRFPFGLSTPQIIPFLNIELPFLKTPSFYSPHRGDLIVFIYPGHRHQIESNETTYYLKRCVAISGDTLQMINDSVYVNGMLSPMPEQGKYDMQSDYAHFREQAAESDKISTFPEGMGNTRSNYGPLRIPKEGDVIQLTPENIRQWRVFIRREGHSVKDAGSTITIDDKPATEYRVERDYVFGMGDNRWNSEDSRFWGFIPKQNIVGTPMFIYWSVEKPYSEYSSPNSGYHFRWSRIGTITR